MRVFPVGITRDQRHNSLVAALQDPGIVRLNDLLIGVFMSAVFGVLIALTGCLRGIQCGRSASAVGDATTSAVVTAIVWIIVWCAITTVMFQVLGI